MSEHGLLFVYKADSGLFNTATDIAHKILSPATYECKLCALTHGYFTMRKEWAGFLEELGVPCEFRHRDELQGEPGVDPGMLPAVYRWKDKAWQPCARPQQIEACADLNELKTLLRACLQE